MKQNRSMTLQGIIAVIPTPFTISEERVDTETIRRLVESSILDGADALGLFGAGGEFYKLSGSERRLILDTVVEVSKGKIPIVASVTEHATCLAVSEAKDFERNGANIINIFPPHFASPTLDSIISHILSIANAVNLPIMIQHAPRLTGFDIPVDVYKSISEDADRPLYIKVESEPTGPAITKIIESTNGKYKIVVGNAGIQMYEALIRKACAIMPGAATIRAYSMIYKAFTAGHEIEAFHLYQEMLPYINILGTDLERFILMEKIVLERRGILVNHIVRNPGASLDEVTMNLLIEQYERIKNVFHLDNPEY